MTLKPCLLTVALLLFSLPAFAQSSAGSTSAAPVAAAPAAGVFAGQGEAVAPGAASGPAARSGSADSANAAVPGGIPVTAGAVAGTAAPDGSAAPANPALEPSEFQRFVAGSTGRLLPRFGANLFSATPTSFAPLHSIPVPPDYVIGPGDEVVIRYWGQFEGDHRLTVDPQGSIQIPRVGMLTVAGTRLRDLAEQVRLVTARLFQNFELSVTLGQLRSIQVYVVGRARRPGSYTLSSLSTLMSALFASGGPSSTGSMRRVQLRRGASIVTEFDLYQFLARGDQSADRPLLSGDMIFFPPEGPQVAVTGSVNVPAVYELKGNTSLGEVIELAGGLTTVAAGQKVFLERIVDRRARRVEQYSLDPAGLAREVRDGDLISVQQVSPRFENAVTLRGNVAVPLRHPYSPGMKVSDLIPGREALIVPDYYIRRNVAVRILPRSQEEQREDARRGENGRRPGDDDRLLADIRRTNLDINWDYAAIERLDPKDLSTVLLTFNLGKAVLERDPEQDIALQPGDVVTIFSQGDITVPVSRRANFVMLEDEFKQPGLYRAEPGETLRQLVVRVGGLSPDAYMFGAVFTRESTRIEQQKSLDEVIRRMEIESQRNLAQAAQGIVVDAETLKQQDASRQALLARMRQLKSSGRIVLNLPVDARLANIPDLPLEDGDRLQIPVRPSVVHVLGAVHQAGSLAYRPDLRVVDYLAQAGGATGSADLASAYILRADGSVISKRQSVWLIGRFESERLMPGDAIIVPEDFDHTTWARALKDWSQILFQFGLGAAAIKILTN